MQRFKSPLVLFIFTVILIGLLSTLGPEEKSLGTNVRLVYLHATWVLTAEFVFAFAALTGLFGLLLQKNILHAWSTALGKSGIFFWITYLPLSLIAMQANWNGLFLAEPRFRLAMIFAVTGLLMQAGLYLFNIPWLHSLGNILYFITLQVSFATAQNVMHPPPSPIFGSGNMFIIGFFIALFSMVVLAAYFLTRFFIHLQENRQE
jgi:hypothetical protein